MPRKKTKDKSNLVLWIVGAIILVSAILIICSNKTGSYIGDTGDVVYETQSQCATVDSSTISCDCDVVIGGDTEHYKFNNKISATSCDNNICNDLCKNYAEELVNK